MRTCNPAITCVTPLVLCLAMLAGCSQPVPGDATAERDSVEIATESADLESGPLHLGWDFNDGDLFRWTHESRMEMEGPQGDEVVKATMKVRMTFDVSVEALDGDRFRVVYDLDQLQVTSDAPGTEIDYDSTEVDPDSDEELDFDLPDEEFAARMYEQLFGDLLALQIETVTDNSGMIHELSVGGELEQYAQQDGLQSLLFLIEQDGLNSLHAGGFVLFPDGEITPDFTWEQSTDVVVKYGTFRFTHSATYVGPEVIDGVEMLRFETAISSSSVARNAVYEDLMEMEDEGGSGVLYINQQTGHLASYSFRSDQKMTILGSSFGGEDMEGTITYFSESTVERVLPLPAGTVE